MTCCVTKATPFQFIDSNILKSRKTCLTNHTRPISNNIMPVVINALGSGHTGTDTDTHTDLQTKTISRNQVRVAFGCKHLVKNNLFTLLCIFLVMNSCSCYFLLTSLYIYSNKIIMAVGLTYERLVFK